MRGNDLIFAFPSLVIAILITAVFGPSAVNAILAIGIFNVPVFARVARGGALPIWTLDYVLAAPRGGQGPRAHQRRARAAQHRQPPDRAGHHPVLAGHSWPRAALSYVGLGAQPPTPSWGRMLAEAQTMIYSVPRVAILPGLAIVATVLALNLLGDGLRDALDPRLRRGRA